MNADVTMKPPIVSVVIPVFNRQDGALRAIESVLAQGIEEFELLLIDDASIPAFSLPPALATEPRIRLVRHETNRGAAAARNTGMRQANGAWIAFLDSDDWWLPDTLGPRLASARAAAAAGEDPLVVHVAGFRLMRVGAEHVKIRIPVSSSNPVDFASGCWFCPGSTALFRRDPMLARVGEQDERLRRFEDVDWFLRIVLAGGRISSNPIVAAVINVGNKPAPQLVEYNGAAIVRMCATSVSDPALRAILLRRIRAWFALERASAYWYSGRRWQALIEFLRSWWWAPRLRLHIEDFWNRAA
jgi:glycosyltransferase involved in cell wall biosynthesis